jgi:1,5-anhydro-D-fructose reductase (1,5-anhydro-D-mannitol-forming)
MAKKIRYGIIGFGAFAERAIAPAIRRSTNSELVAIQKRSLRLAKEKAAVNNIPLAFDSAEDLVHHKDVDAVFIASVNSHHCPETVIAARAGKHVLVEKPMATNAAEAKKMIEACRKNGVKLMVAHMVRFSPLVIRMRQLIDSGSIGAVTYARTEYVYDGRTSKRRWLHDRRSAGGGPLFDIGVHCLDALSFVLGKDVLAVRSQLEPVPTKARTESTANVVLKFSGGTLASIYCSYAAPIRRSTIEVIGTEGMLLASDFTMGEKETALQMTIGSGGITKELETETIEVPNLYLEEINHFSSCILNNTEPIIPGEVGLSYQRILDEALKDRSSSGVGG